MTDSILHKERAREDAVPSNIGRLININENDEPHKDERQASRHDLFEHDAMPDQIEG